METWTTSSTGRRSGDPTADPGSSTSLRSGLAGRAPSSSILSKGRGDSASGWRSGAAGASALEGISTRSDCGRRAGGVMLMSVSRSRPSGSRSRGGSGAVVSRSAGSAATHARTCRTRVGADSSTRITSRDGSAVGSPLGPVEGGSSMTGLAEGRSTCETGLGMGSDGGRACGSAPVGPGTERDGSTNSVKSIDSATSKSSRDGDSTGRPESGTEARSEPISRPL